MIYITGHRKPDTDSAASAIAYARLKQAVGEEAQACCLGELNPETHFILERFHIDEPKLLKDARNTLEEIELDGPRVIREDDTIFTALQIMERENRYSLAVVDPEGKLTGIVSNSDLARIGLRDTAAGIDLLSRTSIRDITETISGTLISEPVHPEAVHLNGKVSIIAMTSSNLENYELKDRIVICGDNEQAQLEVIRKDAGLLILVWTESVHPRVLQEAARKNIPVILSGHGSMNTVRYLYFAPPVRLVMNRNVICFSKSEFVEDALAKVRHSRCRSYPVLNEDGTVYGFLERYHLLQAKKKQLILVDHNEFSQSVRNIEQAEVVEVIDHHRISDFSTVKPVLFRCEKVGCTATIITKLYRERQVQIPKEIAGLLLSAILSDTLKFRSPTTTQEDIFTAQALAAIAGLNVDEYAREMFEVTTSLKDKSVEKIIDTDIKPYEISDKNYWISQTIVYSLDDLKGREEEIEQAVQKRASEEKRSTIVAAFTSIQDNGSIVYAAGPNAALVESVFPSHEFQQGILSRKTQIVPMLTGAGWDL